MALSILALDIISQLLKKISHRPVTLLSAGYPDVLTTVEKVKVLFGDDVFKNPVYRSENVYTKDQHPSFAGHIERFLDAEYLLNEIGVELTVIDTREFRGGEIICDLNEPLPPNLKDRFDIVLDGGTLEHCFNVGQSIKNFLGMAKTDGYVIHFNPLSRLNHGFFNFCPTFYHDFYTDNGHSIVSRIAGVLYDGLDYKTFLLPSSKRIYGIPESADISVVVQKAHSLPPKWPVQSKYKPKAVSIDGD